MTENEARLILDVRISRFDHAGDVNEALEIAKQALEEIQQYRAIGTVKECKEMASIVKKSERSELATIIDEWLKYRKIGTVEECRGVVEKQKPKKVKIKAWSPVRCPSCDYELSTYVGDGYYKHPIFLERCPQCGQKLDWSEEE